MSLYSIPFYSKAFYGTDLNSGPPGGIFGLNGYQNVDGTVILYWRYDPCTSALANFTWTVETDLVPTFDSSSLRTYSSVANPNYLAGGVHKGIVVDAYKRQQGVGTPMYWRVQGHYANADTGWASSTFVIPSAIDDLVRQAMLDTLPDQIYKKDFAAGDFQLQSLVFEAPLVSGNVFNLTVDGAPMAPIAFSGSSLATMNAIAAAIAALPNVGSAEVLSSGLEILVTAAEKDAPLLLSAASVTGGSAQPDVDVVQRNSTNVNRIFTVYGKEMDRLRMNLTLVQNDLFTQSVRDQSLDDNFASLLGIQQPAGMATIDFREIVRAMLREAGGTPTLGSIRRVLSTMYCANPTFTLVRDTLDMYVNDTTVGQLVDPFWVDDPLSVPPVLPATVWDDQNLAFGVIVTINNPLGLSIPADFVQAVVSKMAPVHAPVYLVGI